MESRRKFLGQVASGLAVASVPVPSFGAGDRIRVGVIGMGDRGLELVNQIRSCQGAEVVAYSDIYSKRIEKASLTCPSARSYGDYRELLDDKSVDAVVIATPPHLHAEQFCAALAAGKHVYLEKTLALSLDDLKQMRASFEKDARKHTVQIGHQACSSGHASDVARFLAQPEPMGAIHSLAMRHYRNTPANRPQWARPALLTSDVNPRNVRWDAFERDSAAFDANRFIHWRYFWNYSGGAVSENMSQQLAFWYRALNLSVPASATMTGGVYLWEDGRETPDTMQVAFHQPEHVMVSWSAGFGNNQLGVSEDLLGHGGTISRNNQVRYIPQKISRPNASEMLGHATSTPQTHMQNFLDAIRFGSEVNCPFELGYRVSIACVLAVESYRRGRTVYWNAETEEIV